MKQSKEVNGADQLIQKLKDKEKEVDFLQSQQRDIRFLAKRLNIEIQIRLDRRANANKPQKVLSYGRDSVIDNAVKNNQLDLKDVQALVKNRDSQNVSSTTKIANYPKLLFWKLMRRLYLLSMRVVKKVVAL